MCVCVRRLFILNSSSQLFLMNFFTRVFICCSLHVDIRGDNIRETIVPISFLRYVFHYVIEPVASGTHRLQFSTSRSIEMTPWGAMQNKTLFASIYGMCG